MSEPDNNRIQKLFLAALELPVDQRDAWLAEQCGDDANLLSEVRALLEHDSPDDDPLEKGLDEALEDIPTTLIPDSTTGGEPSESEMTQMDGELFLSKLSEVGVLSPEEVEALSQTVASGQSSANPRQLASQLVSQGRLTDYQASALLKGQPELLIDKYLILDLLDAGGMGMVFKAIHRPMNRTVAIKMIAQHLLASPEQVKRFQREVRVAATLEHPNIVRSYDADRARGVHFLVMEYVRGDNLATIVRRQGPMSVEQAVDCIRQAAKGLRYAQKQGVIHRDIKPGNLMLNDEELVKVLDLGLANIDASFRLAQQSSLTGDQDRPTTQSMAGSELTSAGAVLGTVSFMAPEQSLDARKADTRADIYSLGCTLYYLLIGEAPYKGDTIFQVFMEHREGEIPTLRDKRPDVPGKVEAVCQKMLAKAPEDRYQSMGELLAGIEDCDIAPPPEKVTRSVSEGRAKSPVSPTVALASQGPATIPPTKSRGILGWLSATVLLLALGGGYWWWQNNADQEDTPTQIAGTTPTDDGDDSASITQRVAVKAPHHGLQFGGDGDYVELPHFGYDGKSPLTIEFWYESPQIQVNTQSILSIDGHVWVEGFESNPGWRLRGRANARVFNDASAEDTQITNKRVHIAIAFNGSTAEIFLGGTSQSVSLTQWDGERQSRSPVDLLVYPIEYRLNNGMSVIGASYTSSPAKQFVGMIDEVRISTSARYTEDFTPQDRFEADDDTLALYHFDEGSGDVLTDSSGNGHHGKIVGAQWVKVYDEANMSAADLLATGEYEWRVVERLPEPINTPGEEHCGDISSDGCTIVFASGKDWGSQQLWMATRDSIDSPWPEPQLLGDQINSSKLLTHPILSPDGLQLTFTRFRDKGGREILHSLRETTDDAWPTPTLVPGLPQNGLDSADISPDQLSLVVHRIGPHRSEDSLFYSRRHSADRSWQSLEPITSLEGRSFTGTMPSNGRLLVFSQGWKQNADLWMMTRKDWDGDWSEPKPIQSLNSAGYDDRPRLQPDGSSILFSSDRRGGKGGMDLYLARLVRKDSPENKPIPESLDAYDDSTWISILPVEGQLDYWGIWQSSEDRTQLVDGEFHAEDAGGIYDGLQYGGLRVNDAVIRSKATKDGRTLELRLRNSHQNGWYAAKWQNTNLFEIRKQVRDAPEDPWKQMVLASRTTGETYGETLELAFSAIGSQLALYVNGQLVLSANDSELPSGAAGFQVNNAKATFKELKIQILDEPQPSIAPFMDAGQWAEAIALGEKKISHKPSDAYRWLQVAPAYVFGGDEDAYREFCRRMLKQFEGNTDEVVMERMIHAGLLLPGVIEAQEFPGGMLIQALSEAESPSASSPWKESACALFAYRASEFEQAVEYAQQSNSHNPKNPVIAMNHSIMAMIYHQQGNTEQAQQALELAAQAYQYCRIHYENLGIRNPHPHDLWMPDILYAEAKATVSAPKPVPNTPTESVP